MTLDDNVRDVMRFPRLDPKRHACLFGSPVALTVVAIGTTCDEVIPGGATAAAAWQHVVNRHRPIATVAAIRAAVIVAQ